MTTSMLLGLCCWQLTAAPVSAEEAAAWQRWLIPLPKQITFGGQVELAPGRIAVRTGDAPDEITAQAAAELRALVGEPVGDPAFEILLGVAENGHVAGVPVPGLEAVAARKYPAQSYLIRPLGEDRLVLAALAPPGVYYAAQTLRQLLEGGRRDERIYVPLAEVLDGPDLEERGEWGGSSVADIEWLTAHKMNLVEAHVELALDEQGKGTAHADAAAIDRARVRALNFVPILTHLDHLGRIGIYERYPELEGKGDGARYKSQPTVVAPCLSAPGLLDILAAWMVDLGQQPGVTDICAWLTELHIMCGCENCQKEGQYVLETRALVNAWRQARRTLPDLRLRILLTQGSYDSNEAILAEVPPEVGVTYYDGGRTYDSSRDPMIYPLLEEFAAKGRWLGVYPQVTASWRIVSPWSGPQFIRTRMNEFVDKQLRCLVVYATPNNRLYDFNVTASAEWSWNAKGRDEHEFAAAWATRRGLPDPDKVADWAVLLGPVGWDVYGSRVPYSGFFGGAARQVQQRRKAPFGKGIYRYFPDAEALARDLAIADEAMGLAEAIGVPELIEETRVLRGYLTMLDSMRELGDLLADKPPLEGALKERVQAEADRLGAAGLATAGGLRAWEAAANEGAGGVRFKDTVDVVEQTVYQALESLTAEGIRNPLRGVLPAKVGGWEDKDFEAAERVTKVFDVTDALNGPGTYEAEFRYTKGWHGLHLFSAALAAAPPDLPETRQVLVADEHEGMAAYRNRDNTYTLAVDALPPGQRILLVVDIRGTRSSDKPANRQGCNGEIWLRKVSE